jgi:meromycolic acid enoyl-[acyl-carrier-protein] reductase
MGLLTGKSVLVTGVLTDDSLAFSVARRAQEEGAELVLTGFGRGLSLTRRVANRLPSPAPVLELDVTDTAHLAGLADAVREHQDHLDGVVHAIGFAPATCLGQGMFVAGWDDVSTMLHASTYSLKALVEATLPLFPETTGGSVVSLDFDATTTWPGYDWMGVAKAGLESLARYLARDLGSRQIRVNLVAAGPLKSIAAKSIPGFDRFEEVWHERAPLGWDTEHDHEAVAGASVALLSDLFLRTTGEMIHVDGGFHAVGA